MVKLIKQTIAWLQGGAFNLLMVAGVILLVWGVFSPVGTLVWWLNQSAESLGLKNQQTKKLPTGGASNSSRSCAIDCYIIFLPGVGDFSADQLTPGEEFFLSSLTKAHPNCVAVADVFPYSAANESLGGRRVLAPLWQAAERADGWFENADVLIKIRNLWRFAISADERYGPVYNRGIADAIVERMNATHPIPNNPESLKLVLIGTSGGAQVALGAVPHLEDWFNSEIIVISIGGDFDGEVGFTEAEHVYHLQGRRDWVEDISRFVFPSRWAWTIGSPFNQARQQGRYTTRVSGPHAHSGDEGYFGEKTIDQTNTTYVELTLKEVQQLPIWSKNY